jgi:hypothetical protein
VNRQLSIDAARFNNDAYLRERVASAQPSHSGAVRTALRYLYLDRGPTNLPPDRKKVALQYLDEAEKILIKWLATRTNGRLRKSYGARALIAARQSRYICTNCGFADVRALHLDHVNGHVMDTSFACLCANCHNIKSRASDWSGKAKSSDSVEVV